MKFFVLCYVNPFCEAMKNLTVNIIYLFLDILEWLLSNLPFPVMLVIILMVCGVWELSNDTVKVPSNTEVTFRAACDNVKGQTVWNGKNWECIK